VGIIGSVKILLLERSADDELKRQGGKAAAFISWDWFVR